MTRPTLSVDRAQSPGEELANSISHGIGFLLSAAAAPVLIVSAAQRGGAAGIVGASVFAATMLIAYLSSSLYHLLANDKAKRIFHILDHSAIFLLIAGTYTPFTLGVLKGAWGWTLFGLVWGIAVVGILIKAIAGIRWKKLSTILYLAMGWLMIIAIKPLWQNMPSRGLFWLIAGGVAYTAGVGFFAAKRVRYMHLIWHLFVMVGTICHFFAVWKYAF